MASLKVIAAVSVGALVAGGAIVGMNMVAQDQDTAFVGGVTETRLPRDVPNSNPDPFQLVADQDEAARRATSNRLLAEQAVAAENTPAYTAPPVIQREGSSGDASDPMASAIVDQEPALELPAETVAPIEAVQAEERTYKVPEAAAVAQPAQSAAPNQDMALILRQLFSPSASPRVTVQDFDTSKGTDHGVPMVMQRFGGGAAAAGNAGLPHRQLPDPKPAPVAAPATVTTPSSRPPAIVTLPSAPTTQPAAPAARSNGALRTIDPNSSGSYIDGALTNGVLGYGLRQKSESRMTALDRKYDAEYAKIEPVKLAQVAIDNNARIYDTARNGQAFDAGTVIVAGDQRYATLMYGFNSDDAAQLPVFAQIHDYSNSASSAFMNGARAQGTLRLSTESAVIEFDKLILKDGRIVPIQAMAISADQLRVGVFKDVNRHTVSRYSSLLVSGLLAGVGEVGQRIVDQRYSNEGNTIIIGDNAQTGYNSDEHFTDRDRAAIAMGAVRPIGDALTSAARQGFNRKPTVTAPAGFGLSIVFLDGLTYSQLQ